MDWRQRGGGGDWDDQPDTVIDTKKQGRTPQQVQNLAIVIVLGLALVGAGIFVLLEMNKTEKKPPKPTAADHERESARAKARKVRLEGPKLHTAPQVVVLPPEDDGEKKKKKVEKRRRGRKRPRVIRGRKGGSKLKLSSLSNSPLERARRKVRITVYVTDW